jgi:hypothetical protein
LGPAADDSDLIMELWSDIGREAEEMGVLSYYSADNMPQMRMMMHNENDSFATEFNQFCDKTALRFSKEFLLAMLAWHCRPWFSRVWVLQEFGLARVPIFVCGSKNMTADRAMLASHIYSCCVPRFIENVPEPDLIKQDGPKYREVRYGGV